jgi:hypothetical protein
MKAAAPSFWELLADKLALHPELLAVARGNCARWMEQGHSAPRRLRNGMTCRPARSKARPAANDCG